MRHYPQTNEKKVRLIKMSRKFNQNKWKSRKMRNKKYQLNSKKRFSWRRKRKSYVRSMRLATSTTRIDILIICSKLLASLPALMRITVTKYQTIIDGPGLRGMCLC
jgi:hypothetical protein